MSDVVSLLMAQFLDWVSRHRRTYAETMEAWKSTCPRTSVWEDALAEGLIEVEDRGQVREAEIVLTEKGRAIMGCGQ